MGSAWPVVTSVRGARGRPRNSLCDPRREEGTVLTWPPSALSPPHREPPAPAASAVRPTAESRTSAASGGGEGGGRVMCQWARARSERRTRAGWAAWPYTGLAKQSLRLVAEDFGRADRRVSSVGGGGVSHDAKLEAVEGSTGQEDVPIPWGRGSVGGTGMMTRAANICD